MKKLFLGVVVSTFSLCPTGGHAQTQEVTDWPSTATLSYSFCQAGTCTTHPVTEVTLAWDPSIVQAKVLPTPKVRFGPFHVSAEFIPDNPSHLKAGFEITVWARSPALYADGRFVGANLQMRMIGRAAVSLQDSENNQDLFVTANLPSIFTALQIRAKITGPGANNKTSSFPSPCGDLPSEGGATDLDSHCMRAAVNPLAAAVPHVAPLAIVYEPPGNCSFASLTETDVVGAMVRVQDTNSTIIHSLQDPGPLASVFGAKHNDFTDNKLSSTARTSRVIVSRSNTFGTLLSSGPDPRCTDPQTAGPSREHRGPGQGDLLLLLINPPVLYWDTANYSNFLFASDWLKLPPDHPTQLLRAFAWQFASPPDSQGNITVGGVKFSADEAKAIVDLNPFTKPLTVSGSQGVGPFSYPELPKRFILMSKTIQSGVRRAPETKEIIRQSVIEADSQACAESSSTNVDNNDPDFITQFTVTALKYDLSALVSSAGGNGSFGDIAKGIADAIKGVSNADILGHSETKTTVTYASCKNLQQSSGEETTQRFVLMDTDQDLHVLEYYDSFFGTVAFAPLPSTGMGMIRNPKVLALRIPNFVWESGVKRGQSVNMSMPVDLYTKLTALGFTRLQPAALQDLVVPRQYAKGLLPGLTVSQDGKKLAGQVSATEKGAAQTLFLAMNSQGKPVALLWISTLIKD